MKYFYIFLILICFSAENQIHNIDKSKIQDDIDYLCKIIEPFAKNNTNINESKGRIIECIVLYALYYNHPIRLVGRMCRAESGFRYWIISEIYFARGLFQVRECHNHILYKIDEPILRKTLLETGEHEKYWLQIGYNTKGAMYILRYLKDKYKTYPLALVAYGYGENSETFKDCLKGKRNPKHIEYVKKIMQE